MKESDYINATAITHVRTIVNQLRGLAGSERAISDDELAQIEEGVYVWLLRLEKRIGVGDGERIPSWPLRRKTDLKPGDVVLVTNQVDASMNGLRRVGNSRSK